MTQPIGTITTTRPTAQQGAMEAQVVTLRPGKFRKAKPANTPRVRKPSLRDRLAIGSATSIGAVGIGSTASSLSDLADTGDRTGRRLEALCACHGKFHRHGVFQLVHRRGCPHRAQADRQHQGGNAVTSAMSAAYAMARHAEGQLNAQLGN